MRTLPGAATLLVVLLSVWGAGSPASARTVSFAADESDFPNPERGWQETHNPGMDDQGPAPLTVEALKRLRTQNVSLVDVLYLLKAFRDGPISQAFLDRFAADLGACRTAGVKMVVRFAYLYNHRLNEDARRCATLDRVLQHIAQLRPLLQANSDVIVFMEAGFIGCYGEWHGTGRKDVETTGGMLGGEWVIDVNDQTRAVLDALLDALSRDRMVCIRYISQLQELNHQVTSNEDPSLTYGFPAEIAFNGSFRARLGRHHDGFHYDGNDDMGSWSPNATVREAEKRYLDSLSQYTFSTGEPTGTTDWTHANSPIPELERHHWDTISRNATSGDLYDWWRETGVYDEVSRRLGYRLRLVEAEIPSRAKCGGVLQMDLRIANDGFAGPKNPRKLEVVLREKTTRAERRLDLTSGHDPRLWFPGEHTVRLSVRLPRDLPAGDYEVLLNLPDPAPRLHGRREYSIRLANRRVWEEETGYNSLLVTVRVEP